MNAIETEFAAAVAAARKILHPAITDASMDRIMLDLTVGGVRKMLAAGAAVNRLVRDNGVKIKDACETLAAHAPIGGKAYKATTLRQYAKWARLAAEATDTIMVAACNALSIPECREILGVKTKDAAKTSEVVTAFRACVKAVTGKAPEVSGVNEAHALVACKGALAAYLAAFDAAKIEAEIEAAEFAAFKAQRKTAPPAESLPAGSWTIKVDGAAQAATA